MNFPSLSAIFGGQPAAPAAPVNPAAAAPLPNGEMSTLENPGVVKQPGTPGQPATPGTPATEASPLEPFKGLWDDPVVDEKSGKGKPAKIGLTVDPAKIREAVGRMDFSKVVDPALVAKALAGDGTSFTQVLGTVAQAVMTNAMVANSQLLDRALKSYDQTSLERLPSELRKHSLSDASFTENPELQHPAVRPLFQMVQDRFAAQYPDATTAELKKLSSDYLSSALKASTKGAKEDNASKKPNLGDSLETRIAAIQPDTNWDELMSGTGPTG